jgi:hypothetical protein
MTSLVKKWDTHAKEYLLGRKIVDVRYMDADERAELGWTGGALVLVLDNGTVIWPSMDDEGNGPGALHGFTKEVGLRFPTL